MLLSLNNLNGTGKLKREDYILFLNINVEASENGITTNEGTPEWYPIGEDNDDISREMNNELEAVKNVLGQTSIDHDSGNAVTSIDPIAIRGSHALSTILYYMYKYDLVGDKAKLQFMEVTMGDLQAENNYGAFTQYGILDLKSWGGDTKKINSPIDINWIGAKTHGTFNPTTKAFTETTEE